MNDFKKIILAGVGMVLISILVFHFSGCSALDFSNFKFGLAPAVITEATQDKGDGAGQSMTTKTRSRGPVQIPKNEIDSRDQAQREQRAKLYVEGAVRDYYQGSAEEALRRLARAAEYDPGSYEAYRLSGQIFYEKNMYREAFNSWSRATQLANDDKTIPRDLDVLKKLLTYCRHEKDRLQAKVHREPGDKISAARLDEIQQMMGE